VRRGTFIIEKSATAITCPSSLTRHSTTMSWLPTFTSSARAITTSVRGWPR